MMSEEIIYKKIVLPNNIKAGDIVQIKFDDEGVVYDLFSNDEEHIESFGYDFYTEIKALNQNKEDE